MIHAEKYRREKTNVNELIYLMIVPRQNLNEVYNEVLKY